MWSVLYFHDGLNLTECHITYLTYFGYLFYPTSLLEYDIVELIYLFRENTLVPRLLTSIIPSLLTYERTPDMRRVLFT